MPGDYYLTAFKITAEEQQPGVDAPREAAKQHRTHKREEGGRDAAHQYAAHKHRDGDAEDRLDDPLGEIKSELSDFDEPADA